MTRERILAEVNNDQEKTIIDNWHNPWITPKNAARAMSIYAKLMVDGSSTINHTYEIPKKLISELAKSQSLAFDRWKRENCITYDYENDAYSKLIFLDVDLTRVRTEQLSIDDTYSQFIEQQNQTKGE